MTRAAIAVCVVCMTLTAGAEGPKPASMDEALISTLSDAKWSPPKAPGIPAGALVSPIAVDPASGASMGYAKFPGGYVFPAHWHSANEYTVLISGKVTLTVNGKASELSPGAYAVIPAKTPHQLTCAAGAECVLLTRRAGATDYHWVK